MKKIFPAPTFALDTQHIDKRLRARLGKGEFAALVTVVCFLLGITYLGSQGMPFGIDYTYFTNAVHGDFRQYRYAHWFLPVLAVLDALPGYSGFILWGLMNIAGIWYATRVFGGNPVIVLLSYQMLYTLFYGQIIGVIAAGLGFFWWGLSKKRWELAGLGLALAVTKLQVGVPVGLTLLLVADISWYARLRVMLVVLVITLISLIIYPLWPFKILEGLESTPPDNRGSVAILPFTGAVGLLLWLPPLLLPLPAGRRVVAIAATTALALPYFQSNDLVVLAIFPTGWLGLLGNLGFTYGWLGWDALQLLTIVPIIFYVWIIFPGAAHWLRQRFSSTKSQVHTDSPLSRPSDADLP